MRQLSNVAVAAVSLWGEVVRAQTSGKKNDGTDSNFMDPANNGGHLYASQIILLTLIGLTFGCMGIVALFRKCCAK